MLLAEQGQSRSELRRNPPKVDPHIFKANDIRGLVESQLTPELLYVLGLSFGTHMREAKVLTVVVGRDGRLSGPAFKEALVQGLIDSGVDVIDIGLVPSPVLYYATYKLATYTGIIITGSHNPAEYNGLKMMLKGETLSKEAILALHDTILKRAFSTGKGHLTQECVLDDYASDIVLGITLDRPLRVVIDCGHGAGATVAVKLYEALGVEVIPLHCEVDGRFPAHHPDPSQLENVQELIAKVLETKADCGLAFDGDADRLGVITNEGQMIWPDRQMMLYAEQVLKTHKGASIIYDVKCTQHLATWITRLGGNPVMHQTGHALIKAKMKSSQAPLAGEMSGHFFFSDRWYGFDDALYAGARLLEILANSTKSPSAIFHALPNSVNTPELQIPFSDDEKFSFIELLKQGATFEGAHLVTIDGLRVEYPYGWGLVRASNTSPCLVLRFEANDAEQLECIKTTFRNALLALKPTLTLPF